MGIAAGSNRAFMRALRAARWLVWTVAVLLLSDMSVAADANHGAASTQATQSQPAHRIGGPSSPVLFDGSSVLLLIAGTLSVGLARNNARRLR